MDFFIQFLVSISVLAFLTIPFLLKKLRYLKEYVTLMEEFPGPKPSLIFGSISEYLVPRENLSAVFDRRFKIYGSVLRVWNLTYFTADLFISKPEYLEVILSSTKHIKKSDPYGRMTPWLGTGLLTSTGSKWHLHRKLITPSFHFKILEQFFEVFVVKSNSFVNKLRQLPVDKVVDLMPLISKCTLDIICETAMGSQMNIQDDNCHEEYVSNINELSELTTYREFRPWFWPSFIFYKTIKGKLYMKCLHKTKVFTEKVIEERKLQRMAKAHETNKEELKRSHQPIGLKKRLAFLDLLLETQENNQLLTDENIREEVDTFMFEGYDTTAMAITWTLYLLGRHPNIQDAVALELDNIFVSSQRNPAFDDLADMKYLERVIKESLRLYPSVPFIGRKLEESLSLSEDHTIPAGTNVILDIFHTHRNPDHFPDPDTFNPDNFLPERTRERHPYAYLPFSAGPRNCIGQKFALIEEKTVLCSVLRSFKVEAVEDNISILQELTTKPANGLYVKLMPRNKN